MLGEERLGIVFAVRDEERGLGFMVIFALVLLLVAEWKDWTLVLILSAWGLTGMGLSCRFGFGGLV